MTRRRLTAQQRLAEQRAAAAAARAAAVRRKKILLAAIPTALVVAIVAALVVVKVATDSGPKSGEATTAAPEAVISKLTTIPASLFDAVGVGSVTSFPVAAKNPTALTENGLPRVFYAGAEYCPYCAAERWPVVVAMARFGTWQGLGQTASSPSDTFPNTPTLSFYGATFSATMVTFSGYELQSNKVVDGKYQPLQYLSSADSDMVAKVNGPPNFQNSGSIPFINIGGTYLISGASFSPALLKGKTQLEVAEAINDPSTDIAKAVLGTANLITAAVCTLTKNEPAAVCSSSAVKAAAAKLPNAS